MILHYVAFGVDIRSRCSKANAHSSVLLATDEQYEQQRGILEAESRVSSLQHRNKQWKLSRGSSLCHRRFPLITRSDVSINLSEQHLRCPEQRRFKFDTTAAIRTRIMTRRAFYGDGIKPICSKSNWMLIEPLGNPTKPSHANLETRFAFGRLGLPLLLAHFL